MKLISYKEEIGGTESILGSRAPQGSMWFQYQIRIVYNKI